LCILKVSSSSEDEDSQGGVEDLGLQLGMPPAGQEGGEEDKLEKDDVVDTDAEDAHGNTLTTMKKPSGRIMKEGAKGRKCVKPDDEEGVVPPTLQDVVKKRKWDDVYDALPDATKDAYNQAYVCCFVYVS